MRHFYFFLVSLDQLGNVIALGNPDNTISARVGYHNSAMNKTPSLPSFWKTLKVIIDSTFYPVDGKNHCQEAFYNDAGGFVKVNENFLSIVILTIFVLIFCLFIFPICWIGYLLFLIRPKKKNRAENIEYRLLCSIAKMNGLLYELKETDLIVNSQLTDLAKLNSSLGDQILTKIINS